MTGVQTCALPISHVIELSNLLRSLPIHPLEVRLDPCFRNKAGIDAQLRTLAACDPENKSKRWKTPSRLMKHYWDIYMHRQDLLERDAEAVLRRCPKSSFYDPVL